MPDKPTWYDRLEDAAAQIEALPFPWVDRSVLETTLGIGRRRAQQILQPLVRYTVGKNGLALKEDVLAQLRGLAAGDTAHFERRRRERFAAVMADWVREAQQQPRVLVEAPEAIVNQQFDTLPEGMLLTSGRILIEGFTTPEEAKQKLLALILAIGNDPDGFEARISKDR